MAAVRHAVVSGIPHNFSGPMKRAMRVIPRQRLVDSSVKHPVIDSPLRAWYAMMRHRRYTDAIMRTTFPTMQRVDQCSVAFSLGECSYWVVANVRYDIGQIYVFDVLTNAQYLRYRSHLQSETDNH